MSMFRKIVISMLQRIVSRQQMQGATSGLTGAKTLKNPTLNALLAVAALAYAISPVDMLPDFVPVLGWLDDGLVLWFGLSQALKAMRGQQPQRAPVTVVETTARRV